MDDTGKTNETVHDILQGAYRALGEGSFTESIDLLEKALTIDFDHKEVVAALKCANYWYERSKRLDSIPGDFEKGEYLLNQWKNFILFLDRVKDCNEQGMNAVRQLVFEKARFYFMKVFNDQGGQDPEIMFRLARCYKGKGDYEHAIEYYEAANRQRSEDPTIISELADCYALINEIRASKIFFREAFFLDPQKVEIAFLESLLVGRIVHSLKELGYESPELEEWISVYGVIYGVFTVKRELKSIEFGKLKQSIFNLESELSENQKKQPYVLPRLFTRYFWLIDHYVCVKEDRKKIEDVLKKIRNLDSTLYEKYIN
jgi:tetratricopeptide (TPR) repeat protein